MFQSVVWVNNAFDFLLKSPLARGERGGLCKDWLLSRKAIELRAANLFCGPQINYSEKKYERPGPVSDVLTAEFEDKPELDHNSFIF